MKFITIILFLILTSCKSESKNEIKAESEIDKTVFAMWDNFTTTNPEFKNKEMPESWFFHNNKFDADRLAELTLIGKKKASSGLYSWYKDANADLPKIGVMHIITDFNGKAKAIIEVKEVDTIPFNNISEVYAEMDMGTKTDALKKWKKAHWDFFVGTLNASSEKPTDDMLVVCEVFETIWP